MSRAVLIVDDDPAFRRLAGLLLAGFGLAVAGEADSVTAALAAASALRPAAVLVDVHLADGDGLWLARRLVRLPWRPRVVLTSGDADAATQADVRRCGAQAFVPKDRLPDAALDRLLDRSTAAHEAPPRGAEKPTKEPR